MFDYIRPIALVITVMIFAGLLGGFTNYLRADTEKDNNQQFFWRIMLTSMCASFLIPLFLNTISSSLISKSANVGPETLVLFGFCLLAALTSEKFIRQLSKKVLEDALKETGRNVEDLQKTAGLLGKNTLDNLSKKILRILGNGRYLERTGPGIAKELKEEEQEVQNALTLLGSKGWVIERKRKDGTSNWWSLSSAGKLVFLAIRSEEE